MYTYVDCVAIGQERPYNHDSTASRLLSEVKHDLAVLVLRWGTTLESTVLFFSIFAYPDSLHYFICIAFRVSLHLAAIRAKVGIKFSS